MHVRMLLGDAVPLIAERMRFRAMRRAPSTSSCGSTEPRKT
jgi:hypothetical protein